MQNSEFCTRITNLYGSQTSPVILCMQNSVISIESLVSMGPSPSLWAFACKTATFGAELQVSIGPRPHLSFCACKTAWFAPDSQLSMDSSPHLWICACKTATWGPDLQVSVGPRPHLWFLHAKQRLVDQNNKSLCFPDMTRHFVHVQESA